MIIDHCSLSLLLLLILLTSVLISCIRFVLSHIYLNFYFETKFNEYINCIYSASAFKSLQNKSISKAKSFKMPRYISLKTEADVKRLSKENFSKVALKNKLKEENIYVSITRILKNVRIRRQFLDMLMTEIINISKKKHHLLFLLLIKSFIRIYQKILEKNRMFIYLLTVIRKTARPIAASYMSSTWQETNPNLRSLWIKRSFMSMK